MNYTRIDDHKKTDGSIDWSAYNAAKKRNGESCQKCGAYIVLGGGGSPRTCHSCERLLKDEEITHDKFIRCPKCKKLWSPYDCEQYEVFTDGEHEISCYECDHTFEVSTHLSFSFTSPELITEDSEDEEDEDAKVV